jgi:aldehyde:ferredoxin oxidoreductase
MNKKEFSDSLEEYYKLRGWDKNGIPTKDKLKELDLESYGKGIVNGV